MTTGNRLAGCASKRVGWTHEFADAAALELSEVPYLSDVPQGNVTGRGERGDAVGRERGVAREVEHFESRAIEMHQPAERRQPQLAIGQHDDVVDGVLRQPVSRGPADDAVVA